MAKKATKNLNKIFGEIYNRLFNTFGPQHWWPGDTPFEVAIGAILTQNTNWGNVEKAINNLKSHKALNATALHRLNGKQIAFLIKPTGYFNVKAKRIGSFLDFLKSQYQGSMKKMEAEDMLSLRPKLLDVHGIGPETADSILLYALEKPVFVIDAYTKRVLQRHNIVSEKAAYHEMQEMFHKNLPTDIKLFNDFHALLVKLGKDFCKTKPQCKGCPLRTIDN